MGNPKQKWTAEEEEALRAGIAKHGTGKWKDIQRDPEFNPYLFSRSNIDLKDKWRNMIGGGSGQGARDKNRVLKTKAAQDVASAASAQAPAAPVQEDAPSAVTADGPTKASDDGKSASGNPALIFEALGALKDPNGSDVGAIFNYIERKIEVPPNFRRWLSSKLRRLLAQDKIEKAKNGYKLKGEAGVDVKMPLPVPVPAPREKDNRLRPLQPPIATSTTTAAANINFSETIEDAAAAAAYKIAEAENKAYVAAEAVKEAERVSKMADDADSMLLFAQELFDRCSGGEPVLVA